MGDSNFGTAAKRSLIGRKFVGKLHGVGKIAVPLRRKTSLPQIAGVS